MDWETVTKVWLEPGTDYREKQVLEGRRTKKFNRMPLGQKGIGRFGAHKLGENIELITRSEKNNEIVVNINWSDFKKKSYLEEIGKRLRKRTKVVHRKKYRHTTEDHKPVRNMEQGNGHGHKQGYQLHMLPIQIT